uniref:Uncharacterized protein n=1 Tax=Megaselia scalaris TaxID=36166 RepID=T1GB57_MEGSC
MDDNVATKKIYNASIEGVRRSGRSNLGLISNKIVFAVFFETRNLYQYLDPYLKKDYLNVATIIFLLVKINT